MMWKLWLNDLYHCKIIFFSPSGYKIELKSTPLKVFSIYDAYKADLNKEQQAPLFTSLKTCVFSVQRILEHHYIPIKSEQYKKIVIIKIKRRLYINSFGKAYFKMDFLYTNKTYCSVTTLKQNFQKHLNHEFQLHR